MERLEKIPFVFNNIPRNGKERVLLLQYFAELVRYANAKSSSWWVTSLPKSSGQGPKLITGLLQALHFCTRKRVHLTFLTEDEETLEILNEDPVPEAASLRNASAKFYEVSPSWFFSNYDLCLKYQRKFIEFYSRKNHDAHPSSVRAYSHEIISFLNRELDISLPFPLVTKSNSIHSNMTLKSEKISMEKQDYIDRFYDEGKKQTYEMSQRERNPKSRLCCLQHHGTKCAICGFDASDIYGIEFTGLIHVHHIEPIAKSTRRKTDPINDLIPLCPNCHAAIHYHRDGVMSVEELAAQYRNNKKTG